AALPMCTGEDAEVGFWLTKFRAGRSNSEIRGERQFQTATQSKAINRGNHRRGQLGDALKNARVNSPQRILAAAFTQLRDIRAGGKNPAGSLGRFSHAAANDQDLWFTF